MISWLYSIERIHTNQDVAASAHLGHLAQPFALGLHTHMVCYYNDTVGSHNTTVFMYLDTIYTKNRVRQL